MFCLVAAMLVIAEPTVVVLEEPKVGAHVEDVIRFGTPVVVEESDGDWSKVRYEGWFGWVPSETLLEVESDPNQSNVSVAFRGAYLFSVADTERGPIYSLPFESPVEVVEECNYRWLKVRLFNGLTGYMQRSQLAFERKTMSLDETLQFAKNFLGIRYLYGGTTSFGFDCSGFTQMLFRQMGITIPRNSYAQAGDARFATVTEAQAGDLVFFKNGSGKVVHVAMMLDSEEFIHSFTKAEAWVCTGRLSDPRWSNGQIYYGTLLKRMTAASLGAAEAPTGQMSQTNL